MSIFINYNEKENGIIAGKIKSFLKREFGIESFLAHEDINGGVDWLEKLFEEIKKADTFIGISSEGFSKSPYCLQELGIAEFRKMNRIYLSLEKATFFGSFPFLVGSYLSVLFITSKV
jgi:hypothetical protein